MPTVATTPEPPAIPTVDTLRKMSVIELRKLCVFNRLPVYGHKADIVNRLATPKSEWVLSRDTHRPKDAGLFDFQDTHDGHRFYPAAPQRLAVMEEFIEHKKAQEITDDRVRNIILQLRSFEGFLCMKYPAEFTYAELTLLDCTRYKNWLKERGLKPRTRKVMAITARDFLRFAIEGRLTGPHPDISDPFKTPNDRKDRQSDNVREITFEEYVSIRKGLRRVRDTVILSVLYDSGCRLGEVLGLRVRDFKSDEYGTFIAVDGKTGERDVQLVESVHDLRSWINAFTGRDNSENYLFGSASFGYSRPMPASSFYNGFHNALEAAGLKGEITAHTFRHNRALQFAKAAVQEEVMRGHFGWEKGSDMPSYYIKLASKDVRAAVLKARGQENLLPPEEDGNGKANTTPCASCGSYQPLTNAYCSVCGGGLSVEAKAKSGDTISFLNNLPPEQHTKATQLARMLLNAAEDPETKGLLEGLKESLA
ncbi:MAG: tyrosine-type recombinase/integrase, partial [Candidatus Poseidoniia archaeon]|nr:tyrosine-type recombinase/integrase [Candidatus Poseidoniia archaeon]